MTETSGRKATMTAALTTEQAKHFVDRGYVRLSNCFDRQLADQWRELAFERMGCDPHDPTSWTEERIHLPKINLVDVCDFAPKAHAAIWQLAGGEENISGPLRWGDGFIINFNVRAQEPWQPPSAASPGWHKDGDWFRHFLDSPEQGLLTIVIWSDIEPQSGGTFIAPDSIVPVARYLAQFPEGLHPGEVRFDTQIEHCHIFEEVTGQVGDVLLIHPYMLHAASSNPSGRPRFITNPAVSLVEPMKFSRPDGNYSLIEQAVLHALEVDELDFAITAKRERIVPERELQQQRMLEEQKQRLGQ
jgi:hypothetical protein